MKKIPDAPGPTRTGTSLWTQALNLPCIPIPPRGHHKNDYTQPVALVNKSLPTPTVCNSRILPRVEAQVKLPAVIAPEHRMRGTNLLGNSSDLTYTKARFITMRVGNRMKLRVVTDSSTTVPDEWRAQLQIIEVPAVVNFGHESFLKDEMSIADFYRRLAAAPQPPTTAQPTPRQFTAAYDQAASEGADAIIAVIVSGELSGTLNSAEQAAAHAPIPVHVWDTRQVSMAAGWHVIEAAEMVQRGKEAPAVLARLAALQDRTKMAFSPATLKYIVASGRAPRLRGTIGDLLNIKPIMMTVDGRLELVTQVRSQRRALETILERTLAPFGSQPLRVAVGHCNAPEQGAAFHQAALAYANVVESMTIDLGVVLAALGGPGLLGMAAYSLED